MISTAKRRRRNGKLFHADLLRHMPEFAFPKSIAKDASATVKNGNVIAGTAYYTIQNNGKATLEDVTATAGNTDSSMLDNWGALTIESGSHSGGLNVVMSEEGTRLPSTVASSS